MCSFASTTRSPATNLAIVAKQLDELSARKARLEAERDGSPAVVVPGGARVLGAERSRCESPYHGRTQAVRSTGYVAAWSAGTIPEADRAAHRGLRGHATQVAAKAQEIALIERELAGSRELWQKNLIPITRLTTLEREATRLEGERGQLIAATAASRGKIAETELQILQIDRDLVSEVGKEIREIEARIGEVIERKVTAEDLLKRVEVRAPISGIIHQSIVHTVGGVVPAGETLWWSCPTVID